VSPDGRWIVFVECRNGELMRPDSQLYIVPAGGGRARRMRCNTSRMNSWHSFSPNGRWLVFSSKSRSPYTQMYLTHIDADGNDSPAILVDNTTASNRAVNIPEFVNVASDGLRQIGGPVLDYYRLYNSAAYLQRTKRYQESAAKWRKVVELNPDDEPAHRNLGTMLLMTGQREESGVHFRKASELKLRAALEADPNDVAALGRAAWMLATSPDATIRNGGEALGFAVRAVEISGGKDARLLDTLAAAYAEKGQFANAALTARRAQALAAQQNQAALADAIRSRIALYEADRPFRER
jgi:tetratricopeptide (TPR) repeat protein